MYCLYTNNITNTMGWYDIIFQTITPRHNTFCDTAVQHKYNLILAPNIWQMSISWGRIYCISSVNEAQHLFIQTAWENINLNSTFTNTAVATTVGLPHLYLKWQLKNDGEASALSELLLHLSMTHGSDCHVAHVHQNGGIGTLYTMDEHMDEDSYW